MYDEKLLFESQMIAEDVDLANGSIDLTAYDGVRAGGAEGKLKITLRANGTGVLDELTTITLAETSIDTEDGSFVASVPSNTRVKPAPAADVNYKDKEEVMSMLVSKEANKFVRPTLACGGTFAQTVMAVDIFLEYVPS